MTKGEFIARLRESLNTMPEKDREERISFYSEMIDDRMEEGIPEEKAVEQIGDVDTIAHQILSEVPMWAAQVKGVSQRKPVKPWMIVLLALTAPVWIPLGIAALSVLLSLYVVLWSLILSLWAVELSWVVTVLAGLASGVSLAVMGNGSAGLAMIALALVLAGIGVLWFLGCLAATKGTVWLTKKVVLWFAGLFKRGERSV